MTGSCNLSCTEVPSSCCIVRWMCLTNLDKFIRNSSLIMTLLCTSGWWISLPLKVNKPPTCSHHEATTMFKALGRATLNFKTDAENAVQALDYTSHYDKRQLEKPCRNHHEWSVTSDGGRQFKLFATSQQITKLTTFKSSSG